MLGRSDPQTAMRRTPSRAVVCLEQPQPLFTLERTHKNGETSNEAHPESGNQNTARVRSLFAAALVPACAFSAVTNAAAHGVTPPTTPIDITPPVGNSAFLEGHAFGTQG